MNNSHKATFIARFVAGIVLITVVFFANPSVSYANDDNTVGTHHIYLPVVVSGSERESVTTQATGTDCQLSPEESALAQLLTSSANQQRPSLKCNSTLSALARSRAEDMARRGYFSHVNPDGVGPNYLAIQSGYTLPASYGQGLTDNNIESIGAGAGNAEAMWNAWMESPSHSTHILGAADFYRAQTEYGIGFIKMDGSAYTNYWVIITASPENGS